MLEDEVARLEVYMGERLDAADLKLDETAAQVGVGVAGPGHGGGGGDTANIEVDETAAARSCVVWLVEGCRVDLSMTFT